MLTDLPVSRDSSGRRLRRTGASDHGGQPKMPEELRAIFEAASPEAPRTLAEFVGDGEPSVPFALCRSVADLLRGDYKGPECGKITPPSTVLRHW